MSRKTVLLALALCLTVCLITAGCTSRTVYTDPSPGATAAPQATPESRAQLEIVDHELQYEGSGWVYIVSVVGTAKNVGTERISHSSVKVKFYDADGSLVGNGVDMVSDLDPGETWKFKATCTSTDGTVESYKIGVGSTY